MKCSLHFSSSHSFATYVQENRNICISPGDICAGSAWATLLKLDWLIGNFNIALLIIQQIQLGCSLWIKKKRKRSLLKKVNEVFLRYTSRDGGRLRHELNKDCLLCCAINLHALIATKLSAKTSCRSSSVSMTGCILWQQTQAFFCFRLLGYNLLPHAHKETPAVLFCSCTCCKLFN